MIYRNRDCRSARSIHTHFLAETQRNAECFYAYFSLKTSLYILQIFKHIKTHQCAFVFKSIIDTSLQLLIIICQLFKFLHKSLYIFFCGVE